MNKLEKIIKTMENKLNRIHGVTKFLIIRPYGAISCAISE